MPPVADDLSLSDDWELAPPMLPPVLPVLLPSALLVLLELLRLPLLPAALEGDEPLCRLLPDRLDELDGLDEDDEPLCWLPLLLEGLDDEPLRLLLPMLPEPCEPLCWLPALLVPPTEPELLGEALALPRLLPDELLWLLPDKLLLWLEPGVWFLPMFEPKPSRLASLPFPSVDF